MTDAGIRGWDPPKFKVGRSWPPVVLALVVAPVILSFGTDSPIWGMRPKDGLRGTYFGLLGLALFLPARFLASVLPAEKERGTALSMALAPFPRQAFLRTLAWRALRPWLAVITLLGIAQSWAWSQFWSDRWYDPWGIPVLSLCGPLGLFVISAGLSLWAGVRCRTSPGAVALALVLGGVLAGGFCLLAAGLIRIWNSDLAAIAASATFLLASPVIWWIASARAAADFDRGILGWEEA